MFVLPNLNQALGFYLGPTYEGHYFPWAGWELLTCPPVEWPGNFVCAFRGSVVYGQLMEDFVSRTSHKTLCH